jgi:hypothetical protein
MSAGYIYARVHARMRRPETDPANPANPATCLLTCGNNGSKITSKLRICGVSNPAVLILSLLAVAGFAGFSFYRSSQTPHSPQACDLRVAGFAGFAGLKSSRARVRAHDSASAVLVVLR